jgi:hypothetical protein
VRCRSCVPRVRSREIGDRPHGGIVGTRRTNSRQTVARSASACGARAHCRARSAFACERGLATSRGGVESPARRSERGGTWLIPSRACACGTTITGAFACIACTGCAARLADRRSIRPADFRSGVGQIKRAGSIPLHAGEKCEQRSGMGAEIGFAGGSCGGPEARRACTACTRTAGERLGGRPACRRRVFSKPRGYRQPDAHARRA